MRPKHRYYKQPPTYYRTIADSCFCSSSEKRKKKRIVLVPACGPCFSFEQILLKPQGTEVKTTTRNRDQCATPPPSVLFIRPNTRYANPFVAAFGDKKRGNEEILPFSAPPKKFEEVQNVRQATRGGGGGIVIQNSSAESTGPFLSRLGT